MEDVNGEEHIVMTPTKKGHGHTTLRMERLKRREMDSSGIMHVAGGDHRGIIINKGASKDDNNVGPAQLSLEFRVFLTNASNNLHTQENRELRFWFKEDVSEQMKMHSAQDFFKELISPCEFPRDYVGFIKKIMKLMQQSYSNIKKIEVEMKQLADISQPPTTPSIEENGTKIELTKDKLLEVIESSYPNPVSIGEMAKSFQVDEVEVTEYLEELLSKGLIKCIENKMYTRVTENDTEVKMVKQMPTVVSSQQPTIAIITGQYCEKLAVDAMIENKDTYVRYKTEGESNVYTLGNIGAHRVVSTKLPAIGHSRSAAIASGNTTTRLLGTFQKVEYVFLVGLGGGVPHYTDYSKHVRLGDVAISCCPEGQSKEYIYLYRERVKGSPVVRTGTNLVGHDTFNIKTWCPPNNSLQKTAWQLWNQGCMTHVYPWEDYLKTGLKALKGQEADFSRPSRDTDKLYMSLGGKDVIEVGHPQPLIDTRDPRIIGMPMVHFGAIGSGRMLMRDDTARMEFAGQHGVCAFDTEFDAVLESIYGNRKDNYMLIRGIADYKDGTTRKEWHPYAALAAASFMKSIICALDPCDDD